MITPLDYNSIKDNRWKSISHPPGFTQSHSQASSKSPKEVTTSYEDLKQKRAWDLAFSPAKSLPMQGFMLYMSGGGVQIFSIGIVVMLLSSPFKALANVTAAFAPFAPEGANPHGLFTMLPQKLAYLICNTLTLALGLWKCNSMGILPTAADWQVFERRVESSEIFLS